jgi:hypothetical protein
MKQQIVNRIINGVTTIAIFAIVIIFSPLKVDASILYSQPVHSTLEQTTGATEYSMQYGITGITGTIKSVLYYSDNGTCTNSVGFQPVVRLNGFISAGTTFNNGSSLNSDGSCTYTYTSGLSVVATDLIYVLIPNSANAFRLYGSVLDQAVGTAQHYDYNSQTVTADSILLDYAISLGDSVSDFVYPVSASDTRIISFDPDQSVVATTTTLTVVGYISSSDYVSGTNVVVNLSSISCLVSCTQSFIWYPSSYGSFSYSTTTTFSYNGVTNYTASIYQGSELNTVFNVTGGLSGSSIITKTGFFIVNYFSTSDAISSSTIAHYLALGGLSTSTNAVINWSYCQPFSGEFGAENCLALLFLPNSFYLRGAFLEFRDGFLSYAPWGYVTRFISILTGTATTTLPSLSLTFDSHFPSGFQGKTISFNPIGSVMSSLPLTATSSANKTILDLTMPYINWIIYISVVLAIVNDLIGHRSGKVHQDPSSVVHNKSIK